MTNLKSLRHVNPTTISLLLITVLSLLAYFPLIPYLGFYSDDFKDILKGEKIQIQCNINWQGKADKIKKITKCY